MIPQNIKTCVELIVDVTIIIQLLKYTMIEIYEKNDFTIITYILQGVLYGWDKF